MHKVSAPWRPVSAHNYDGSAESLSAIQREKSDWIAGELGPNLRPHVLMCGSLAANIGPESHPTLDDHGSYCARAITVGVSGGGYSDRQEALERAASAGWCWMPFGPIDIMCPACHIKFCQPTPTASEPTEAELEPQPLDELDVSAGPVIDRNPRLIVQGALDEGTDPKELLERLTGRKIETGEEFE